MTAGPCVGGRSGQLEGRVEGRVEGAVQGAVTTRSRLGVAPLPPWRAVVQGGSGRTGTWAELHPFVAWVSRDGAATVPLSQGVRGADQHVGPTTMTGRT